jgi:hypothetical protein
MARSGAFLIRMSNVIDTDWEYKMVTGRSRTRMTMSLTWTGNIKIMACAAAKQCFGTPVLSSSRRLAAVSLVGHGTLSSA